MSNNEYQNAVGILREAMVNIQNVRSYNEDFIHRDSVLARYQPVFATNHLSKLTKEEFYSFLLPENNHHWSGLYRTGARTCNDMPALRKALAILLDKAQPVDSRIDKSVSMIDGMGKNISTAILLVSQPDSFGVWNSRSEAAMKRLGIWPDFERGSTLGERYLKVNEILRKLRDDIRTDLWTLDSLFWFIDEYESNGYAAPSESAAPTLHSMSAEQSFGLERHLHEFLRDNWNRLDIGKEWDIFAEPGDDEAGYEYPCDVGRIDILAKHKMRPAWLVIELKRNQTSDQTVGQLLRYIGWVKQHLAQNGEDVEGLIVGREADKGLRYALSQVPGAKLMFYEVEFRLVSPRDF